MQCPTCLNTYPDKIANCPRCRRPLSATVAAESRPVATAEPKREAFSVTRRPVIRTAVSAAHQEARVLEFPDPVQHSRPQWRQEVSARLREYQARRGRILDGMAEPEAENADANTAVAPALAGPGVVSLAHRKELEPLVVRALQRLERARQTMPQPVAPPPAPGVALIHPAPEPELALAPVTEPVTPEATSGLVQGLSLPVTIKARPVLEPKPAALAQAPPVPESGPRRIAAVEAPRVRRVVTELKAPTEELPPAPATPPPARKTAPVVAVPDTLPATEKESVPKRAWYEVFTNIMGQVTAGPSDSEKPRADHAEEVEENEDDFAPWQMRLKASAIDWGLAVVASLPFLLWAGLSVSHWHWGQLFVFFVLHVLLFMALYATALTFYAGRTWGQELHFLYVANLEDGGLPTLRQCAIRSAMYLLCPLTLGLGWLYALYDPEGCALHDKVSGTIVLHNN